MLEFSDINVEHDPAQTIALQRPGQSVFIHDLATGDIDEHAPRSHCSKTAFVEEAVRLRRPLAADHYKVAFTQKTVEIFRTAQFAEARRQRLGRVGAAAGANHSHPECGAEAADFAADAAGADDTGRLAFDHKRPIGAMVEGTRGKVGTGTVEALGEM